MSQGVAFWKPESGGPGRVVFGTPDGRLIVLDARNGAPVTTFGDQGVLNLRIGSNDDDCRLGYGLQLVVHRVAGQFTNPRSDWSACIRADPLFCVIRSSVSFTYDTKAVYNAPTK